MSEAPLPFKPGDWVADSADRVRKVKRVYWDHGEVLLDLIVYDSDGTKIGRESPVMGGPRTFEPCCSSDGYRRIAEPSFPLKPMWVENDHGGPTARLWAGETLPAANWTPPKRKARLGRLLDQDEFRRALVQIAEGHNDPRDLARRTLGGIR